MESEYARLVKDFKKSNEGKNEGEVKPDEDVTSDEYIEKLYGLNLTISDSGEDCQAPNDHKTSEGNPKFDDGEDSQAPSNNKTSEGHPKFDHGEDSQAPSDKKTSEGHPKFDHGEDSQAPSDNKTSDGHPKFDDGEDSQAPSNNKTSEGHPKFDDGEDSQAPSNNKTSEGHPKVSVNKGLRGGGEEVVETEERGGCADSEDSWDENYNSDGDELNPKKMSREARNEVSSTLFTSIIIVKYITLLLFNQLHRYRLKLFIKHINSC